MSRTEKKADFITIGIYTVLTGAALYTSAALGACVDLATDNDGRMDFEQLTESLDTTLTDTRLVFSQVQAGGNAAKFPVFAAFGIGIYVLMKITGKKRFHRRGEEHGSAKWAGKREIRSLADRPQKKKKGKRKARDQPEKAGHRKPSVILKDLFSYIRQIPCQLKRIPVRVRSWVRRIPGRLKSAVRHIPGLLKSSIKRIPGLVKSLFRRNPKEFVRDNNIILTNEVKMSLNTRQTRKNLNVMVIGGSGSGKSRFFVKPNMMQANTSYVCTDPKGELLRSCGKMLEHYGYRIKVFNLINMAHSHNYNPFHYIYDADGNYSATAVIKMINVLMKNTQKEGGGGGDQFWEDSTKALLAALCFYLVECEDESKRNFAEVMRLLKLAEVKEDSEDFQSDLDLIFDALEHPEVYTKTAEPTEKMQALNLIDLAKKAKSASRYMCLKYYKDFKKAAGDTAKSILISTAVRLQAFNIPEVMDLTCCDNLHLEMTGDEKTALFIIIPSSDDTFNFLAAMMYTQLFDVLYDRANFKHGGRLPIHVRCLLDEFANLGQIPRFEELLATMRSMEISAIVIIQNLSQLKKMYKDSWENVLGNCDSLLFLGGQEPTTLEHISKTLGNRFGNKTIAPYDNYAVLAMLAMQKYRDVQDTGSVDFHFTENEIRTAVDQFYTVNYHYEYSWCPGCDCSKESDCVLSFADRDFEISDTSYDAGIDRYTVKLTGSTYAHASSLFTRLDFRMTGGGSITGSGEATVRSGTWTKRYRIEADAYNRIDWSKCYLTVDTVYCNNSNHKYLYGQVVNLTEAQVLTKAGFTADEKQIFQAYLEQIRAIGG